MIFGHRAPASTALARYEEPARGLFGRLKGAMGRWAISLGGDDLEQRLARLVAPQNEYGVDPFGLNLEFARTAIAPALWLYKKYFRVQTHALPWSKAMTQAKEAGLATS